MSVTVIRVRELKTKTFREDENGIQGAEGLRGNITVFQVFAPLRFTPGYSLSPLADTGHGHGHVVFMTGRGPGRGQPSLPEGVFCRPGCPCGRSGRPGPSAARAAPHDRAVSPQGLVEALPRPVFGHVRRRHGGGRRGFPGRKELQAQGPHVLAAGGRHLGMAVGTPFRPSLKSMPRLTRRADRACQLWV